MSCTCNQCGKEMYFFIKNFSTLGSACINPSCPNYGLVQMPLELMPKEKVKQDKGLERLTQAVVGKSKKNKLPKNWGKLKRSK